MSDALGRICLQCPAVLCAGPPLGGAARRRGQSTAGFFVKPTTFEVGGFCGFMLSLAAPALGKVMNSDGSLLLGVNVPLLCSQLFFSTVLPPFSPLPVYPGTSRSGFAGIPGAQALRLW